MRAMVLPRIVSLDESTEPLEEVERPAPQPKRSELLVRVRACGVCHTELDEIEGRTPPPALPVILGHEVVGIVERVGEGASSDVVGTRVGVGWIHSSSGGENENLSPQFQATGRDVNGGYAEYMTAPAAYAYPIPAVFSDSEAAPLLCAGAIGYRSLRLTNLRDGEPLGLMGFGGSAHLVLQTVRYLYPRTEVFVFARDETSRHFAKTLGATWAGSTTARAPKLLQAIIDTTPAWLPVVESLANLRAGGRLVINAIRKEDRDKDALRDLSYHEHLWMEREIKSVANITARDIREFLSVAAAAHIRPEVETYALSNANQALIELKTKPVRGAKVLLIDRAEEPLRDRR